jgi:hypothetical protein
MPVAALIAATAAWADPGPGGSANPAAPNGPHGLGCPMTTAPGGCDELAEIG